MGLLREAAGFDRLFTRDDPSPWTGAALPDGAAVQQATVPGSRIAGRGVDGRPFQHRFARHASGAFGPYLQQDLKPAGAVIDDYRAIFRRYELFGDRSWLMRHRLTRFMTRAANFALVRTAKMPLCGWYDTHAAA